MIPPNPLQSGRIQWILHTVIACPLPLLIALGLLLPPRGYAEEPPAKKEAAAAPVDVSAHFPTDRARLWLGHSQMIVFEGNPPPSKQTLPASIEPAGIAEILGTATLLDGESKGYVRLRGLKPGHAKLQIGGATLAIEVVEDPSDTASFRRKPSIVSPVAGAHIWGKIGVGVEIPSLSSDAPETRVILRLPDGREIEPSSSAPLGTQRHLTYEVDAASLPAGNTVLVAVARDASGNESSSDPLPLVALGPDNPPLIAGQCSEQNSPQRPERQGDKTPAVIADTSAPGGNCIDNSIPKPSWCLPFEAPESGYYQVMLTARGDEGIGAYPSIGLYIDDEGRPLTAARLPGAEWRRSPIGRPIYIEAGPHVLTPAYLNDVSAGKQDNRNLYLARYEVARIGPSAPAPGAASTMMAGETPMVADTAPAKKPSPEMAVQSSPRVGFDSIFDGGTIAGPIIIKARANWPQQETAPAPRVDLVLNGKTIQSQSGTEALFMVRPSAFHPGENTVQLRASIAGSSPAVSAIQRLTLPAVDGLKPGESRFLRFTAVDPAWDPSMRQRLDRASGSGAFLTNGESILQLPDDLVGTFRLRLEVKGQEFSGPPVASILLLQPDKPEQTIGDIPAYAGFQTLGDLPVTLAKGPKQIVVRYANDLSRPADPSKQLPAGDRNLWVKALRLEETIDPATVPPATARILYPGPGHVSGMADAVVAGVFAPTGATKFDLLVDGTSRGLPLATDGGVGPLLFPLVTRGLPPGEHTLQVVPDSAAAKPSEIVHFKVSADIGADATYDRAIHLLNHFAYGPEPRELAAVLVLGEKEWLHRRLAETSDSPGERAAFDSGEVAGPITDNEGAVVPRSLNHLLLTPNPVRARFLLWAENHFSTWLKKEGALPKWREHLRFAELGPAPFGDLLMASATSPAMLFYLDQHRASASRINENYAREIMELHTLGVHGGYTQSDVTNLAWLINGWTLSQEAPTGQEIYRVPVWTFRFDPALSSGKATRIFGMEFAATPPEQRLDAAMRALEMLAAHPSTAQFVSRKLAEHYVGIPAPPKLVDDLARVFLETGGDMRAMLEAIREHPDFWSAPDRIATPLDFGLRLSRIAGSTNVNTVDLLLKKSAMGLFDRMTPDGYPEADSNYADSNSTLQRWTFAQAMEAAIGQTIPAAWIPASQKPDRAAAQRLVDLAAVRITGKTLGQTSNDASIDYLLGSTASAPARMRSTANFIARTPEASLR